MAKKSAVRVTPSTGNVFRDLGFSKEESEHLLVRADLLIQVQKTITSRRLTQSEVAKLLRVTQPRGGGGGSRTRVRKHVLVGLYMRVRF